MKIYKFSQLGKRGNNEDCVGASEGLITVCDGMGGHNYGERASAFVVEEMIKAFDTIKPTGKMEIQQQLNKVHDDLNHLLDSEPELENMGTTFTGLFITPDVWYAAHIGDSRIYMFRSAEKKLWHTWDHSLVGELMRTHEITVEAGRFHPMSNRIGKAIIAKKDSKPMSASIVKIDNLQAGDVFLLCSDGVIESWGDHEFVKLFADTTLSFEQKCEKVRKQCEDNSKDNNSAILIEIEEKDAINFGNNDELDWTTFASVEADYQQYLKDNNEASKVPEKKEVEVKQAEPEPEKAEVTKVTQPKKKNNKGFKILLIAAIVICALAVAYFFIFNKEEKAAPAKKETPVQQTAPEKVEKPAIQEPVKQKQPDVTSGATMSVPQQTNEEESVGDKISTIMQESTTQENTTIDDNSLMK